MLPAGIGLAMDVIFGLLDRATKITAIVQQAKTTGQDITSAQLSMLIQEDDVARMELQKAINEAKAKGK